MVAILKKAKSIKSRLESLDKSNKENRSLSKAYKEGSPIDRTRVSVTNGLRIKLKDMMHDFQELRAKILNDHKEVLQRSYYNVTGEQPSEELLEKMFAGGGQGKIFEGKEDLIMENQERHEALKEIQRSLTELHRVFLDMAVLVETQGDEIDNIEENVVRGANYINGGTNGLYYAKQMKKKRYNWGCWIGILLLILLIIFVSILAS
ncbi:hypothetical protein JCGZ_26800 [Jatropha curcas]|uniref:t-SNARE coiled-coil homology domain-containing protein n=2 Tax=Jatropha curcas TaxID=180498 RepID=A0A067L051_JATCU|nr:hypothetical protein JCGZ_26800 [Jatropha curcas]